jgi:hypothetical protein
MLLYFQVLDKGIYLHYNVPVLILGHRARKRTPKLRARCLLKTDGGVSRAEPGPHLGGRGRSALRHRQRKGKSYVCVLPSLVNRIEGVKRLPTHPREDENNS